MTLTKALIGLSFALAIGGLAYFGAAMVRNAPEACQVCYRPVHAGQEYTVVLTDGTKEHTCCPRCGMHFQIRQGDKVLSERATDYATGARIDPAQAIFVEGSDLMTCCASPALKREEPQKAAELIWDRCLPSLVAFKTKTEAQQFWQLHGGRLLSYAEALDSVRSN